MFFRFSPVACCPTPVFSFFFLFFRVLGGEGSGEADNERDLPMKPASGTTTPACRFSTAARSFQLRPEAGATTTKKARTAQPLLHPCASHPPGTSRTLYFSFSPFLDFCYLLGSPPLPGGRVAKT